MSNWNEINPRSFYGEASMKTLDDHTLRAITGRRAGEPSEVVARAKFILLERHTPKTPEPLCTVLSPYERTLQRKTDTLPV